MPVSFQDHYRYIPSAILYEAKKKYAISVKQAMAIFYLPLVIVALYFFLLLFPFSRHAALLSLEENGPVELLTFCFLLLGAVLGFRLALKLKIHSIQNSLSGFYFLFSLGILVIALEEIAWGQHLFGFATPQFWKEINFQNETTLHNVVGLQGHSEVFRLMFGLAAFISMGLSFTNRLKYIACPWLLIFWAVIISTHAAIDVFNDYIPIENRFDSLMQRTSELIEMLIGITAFLYILLNTRFLLLLYRARDTTIK